MDSQEQLRSFQNYRVHLSPKQPVVFSLQSSFDAVLSLADSRGRKLLTNNGKGNSARLPATGSFTVKQEGDYIVQVTTSLPRTLGSFQLETKTLATDPCTVVTPLMAGAHMTGDLSKGDCQNHKGGPFIDRYSFIGQPNMEVMLALDAKFPSTLTLLAPNGRVLATHPSTIPKKGFLKLPKGDKGTYTVEISSSQPATGGYDVQFHKKPL